MTTLGELAKALELELRGDPARSIASLAALESATANDLSFVSEKKHLPKVSDTSAGALILHPDWAEVWSGCALLSDTPYVAFAKATQIFDNHPPANGQVHQHAAVADSARIGADVTIDAGACVEADVVLGDRVWIGAGAYIGHGASIGADTVIKPGAVICHAVKIGRRCTIHPNATIGADGFGYAPSAEGWVKIEQLATVVIGDDVEIGSNSTVDRGALEDTVVEDGVIIDNLVQLGHGVRVGRQTVIVAQVGVSGSTKIGARCVIAGQAGLAGHLVIADDVHIGGQGRVASSVTEAGRYSSGTPIQPLRSWLRSASRFTQLDQMAKRITELEKAAGFDQQEDDKA
jgi:UDP-3-O-[3-hydroxymyristoyl] glucosamine N-acyltransferase